MKYAQIRALGKNGFPFRRSCWPSTSFVFERPQDYIDNASIGSIKSIPAGARSKIQEFGGEMILFKSALCLFSVHPKTGLASVENGWVPSLDEEAVDDWALVEESQP